MKALSLWQPWASLIAVDAKTIETRSWTTPYRGPLLILAAKRKPDDLAPLDPIFTALEAGGVDPRAVTRWSGATWHEEVLDWPRTWGKPMPLGAVVATCDLVDVVPILTSIEEPVPDDDGPFVYCDGDWLQVHDDPDSVPRYSEEEQLYGDYRSGRYAWLLHNIRPLTAPVAARGRQGLWTPDADLLAAVKASA